MKILLGQYHMHTLGGTEDFTYTLATRLHALGHRVDLVTLVPGQLSQKLHDNLGIPINRLRNDYDLCLCNHNQVVNEIRKHLPNLRIIQTSHGTIPNLEKFSTNANEFVSISEEVQKHFEPQFKSKVIWNGIDVNRFQPTTEICEKVTNILSLTQSNEANAVLQQVADKLGANFKKFDKNINPKFNIEKDLNQADLVFGLGRSAYAALACGRPVFVWDWRHYMGNLGDGFLTVDNYKELMKNNTSGRRYSKQYTVDQIVEEIKENYNHSLMVDMRNIALEEFNMDKQIEKYLE